MIFRAGRGGSYEERLRERNGMNFRLLEVKSRHPVSKYGPGINHGLRINLCAPPPGLRIRVTPELKRQMLKGRKK